MTWLGCKSKHKQGCIRYSGSSRKRKPSGREKASITGSGRLQEFKNRFAESTLLRTVCCVPVGRRGGRKALTLSLNSTRLMRTPRSYGHFLWLPQCPWGLRKTGICKSGRNYSCPITRVSVRRTSTVIAFDSSERILNLVFLWYKATNFRDIGVNCQICRRH